MDVLKQFWGPGRLQIDGDMLRKLGRNMLIAGIGAALTVLTEEVGHWDFGVWTGPVMLAVSGAVDALRRLLTDYSNQP